MGFNGVGGKLVGEVERRTSHLGRRAGRHVPTSDGKRRPPVRETVVSARQKKSDFAVHGAFRLPTSFPDLEALNPILKV